jgi:hypothetical protein
MNELYDLGLDGNRYSLMKLKKITYFMNLEDLPDIFNDSIDVLGSLDDNYCTIVQMILIILLKL